MSDAIRGRMLWYELLTTDMKAAETFYSKVVGWKTTAFPGAPQPYDIFTRGGEQFVAGVMNIPEGMDFPPHWAMYVGAANLEASVAQAEKLGGKAMSPVIDVPGVGRMRTMHDPQGAMFALYQPAQDPGPEVEPQVGEASWHELYTTDAEAGMKFYTELFNWKPTTSFDMGPMGKYHMYGRSFDLGGMMTKPPAMAQVPTSWTVYFRVDDVHAAAERIKQNGGRLINDPMEVPGGDWIVQASDPQGAVFALHHKK